MKEEKDISQCRMYEGHCSDAGECVTLGHLQRDLEITNQNKKKRRGQIMPRGQAKIYADESIARGCPMAEELAAIVAKFPTE